MLDLNKKLYFSICLFLFFTIKSAYASEYLPEVYQDEYVLVGAKIMEVGRKPLHLGDPLSFAVEVRFDGNEVLIENMNEELFQRNWGKVAGVGLQKPPVVSLTNGGGNITIMRTVYSFQILSCPDGMMSCPGLKDYELPAFTFVYQVVDNQGAVVSNKSVRFSPLSETLTVLPSVPVGVEGVTADFAFYFPAEAAYSEPVSQDIPLVNGSWLVISGGFILVMGLIPMVINRGGNTVVVRSGSTARWEKALAVLRDDSMNLRDDEWADILRRCVSWYIKDTFNINPYVWLSALNGENEINSGVAEFKEYFFDVLNQEGVDKENRNEYLVRFNKVIGRS